MRTAFAGLACLVVVAASTPAVADEEVVDIDRPEVSADGKRIAFFEASEDVNGGMDRTIICDVGAKIDEHCKAFLFPWSWSGEGGPIDLEPIKKSLADTRAAGGFTPLFIITLHQLARVEEFAPQRLQRSRVTKTSGDITIRVAPAPKRNVSITVSRRKRILASGRFGSCADPRDQAAIIAAVVVGDAPVIYARIACSGYTHWEHVPAT